MFVRKKKIKKKSGNVYEYAYLVENTWKKRGKTSRQKVKSYLGKIHKASVKNDIGFLEFCGISGLVEYMEGKQLKEIVKDLVNWELHKHGIKGGGKDKEEEFFINLDAQIIKKDDKDIVFEINEGFLCRNMINRILRFKKDSVGDVDEEIGYNFAKVFVEAGINVPQEVFVELFKKLIN